MEKYNMKLLLGSQLFSVIGTGMIQFAIALYVLDLTKSALTFSIIASMAIVGKLICLPICGILADRLPKKSLLLTMDISYAILTVGLIIFSKISQSILPIGIILVILGLVSAFETPVVQSTIPLVCKKEEIPQANGMVSSVGIIGNIIAPIMGAVLYNFNAIYNVFYVSIFCYLLAIICEGILKLEKSKKSTYQGNIIEIVKYDTKEILYFLKQNSIVVKICLIAFLLNFLMTSFIQVLVPYLARVQMLVSDKQFGLMNMIFAIGGLVGAIIYSVFGKQLMKISLVMLLNIVAILFGCLVIPYYYLSQFDSAFVVMVAFVTLILSLVTMISIQLVVYVQLVTEQKLLGRVMSFVMIVSTLAIPVGQVLFGFIGNYLTPALTAIVCLVITSCTLIIAFLSRNIFRTIQKTSLENQTSLPTEK